jgi:hypothetical protein
MKKATQNRKPKISYLEHRFRVVKRKASNLFRRKHHKQSPDERQFEEDLAYLIRHVEEIGFKFFPNHYIRDDIEALEGMIESFSFD